MSAAGVVRMGARRVGGRGGAQAVSLTAAAAKRLNDLLREHKEAAGVRLGVTTRGCSGHSYVLNFAEKKEKNEEVVEADGRCLVYFISFLTANLVSRYKAVYRSFGFHLRGGHRNGLY